MKNPLTLLLAIGLASCGAPKAIIVAEVPVKPKEQQTVAAPEPSVPADPKEQQTVGAPEPSVPADPNDGLRLPDMLALPDDAQLRSSPGPAGNGNATVITRPPKE